MTIMLTILKIIGKAILWILAVLVFLILFLLVCPIYYEVKGEKYDNISIEGKVKLLLGIVSIRFNSAINGKTDTGIYVLGKKLGNKNKRKRNRYKEKKYKEEVDDKSIVAAEIDYEDDIDLRAEEIDTSIEMTKDQQTKTYKSDDDAWINKDPDINEPIVRKVKLSDTERSLSQKNGLSDTKVKKIKIPEDEKGNEESEIKNDDTEKNNNNKREDKEEYQELNVRYFLKMPKEERKILVKAVVKLLKSLLKGVKPNKFYLIGTVGLSDPSLTGEVVGAAWVLNGILNRRIEITAAFDKEVIEGKVYIKGNIVPAYMLFCIARFVLVKPVRKIIKLLLKGSGDKNGKRNRK